MSERLSKMVRIYKVRAGKNAMAKLSVETGIAIRTLYLIENDGHIPTPSNVYKLALACGRSEAEALSLADEASISRAKETA